MNWITLIAEIAQQDHSESGGDESELPAGESDLEDTFKEWETLEGKLTPLEAVSLSTVLHICLLQLHILARAQIHMSNLSFITTRKKLINILQETETELRSSLTFEALYTQAQERAANRKQTTVLEDIAMKNADQIAILQFKLKSDERKKQKEVNRRQEVIANLKDQIQELVTFTDIKLRYTDRWETAKQGQCLIRCENSELHLKQQVADIKRRYETEIRIHEEVTSFLTQSEQRENIVEEGYSFVSVHSSFTKLLHSNPWIRSTLEQTKLNNLMIMCTQSDVTLKMDFF